MSSTRPLTYIVPCGAAKADQPAAARDLYTGAHRRDRRSARRHRLAGPEPMMRRAATIAWFLIAVSILVGVFLAMPGRADAAPGSCQAAFQPGVTGVRTSNHATAQVWLYGDSITVQTQAQLRATTNRSIAIDALRGRGTAHGIAALRRDLAATRHRPAVLVMALGTNDLRNAETLAKFRRDASLVRKLLPASTRILWVDTYRYGAPWVSANTIVSRLPGVTRITWGATVAADPALVYDGIHVTDRGCLTRNTLIRSAINRTEK